MGAIPIGIHLNGFSPDEDSARKRIGEKETIPCIKNGLLGGTKGDRNDWFPRQSGQFNHTDLDFVTRSSWSIWNDHDIRSILKGFDHILEARETFASAWAQDWIEAKRHHSPSNDLAIPMRGDEETQLPSLITVGHHQKPSMPEGDNERDPFFPKRSRRFWIDHFHPYGPTQDPHGPMDEWWTQPSQQLLF